MSVVGPTSLPVTAPSLPLSVVPYQCVHLLLPHRYVILPKDFEKGYKANVKKSDTEFAFYQ